MKNNYPVLHPLFVWLLATLLISCTKEGPEDEQDNGLNDLYLYDVNAGSNKKITYTADISESRYLFFHNEEKMIFFTPEGGYGMDVDGSDKIRWLDKLVYSNADISPDDKTIVYSMDNNLFLVNPNGTNKRQFTSDNMNYQTLKWSGDGKKIACLKSGALYIISLDGVASKISETGAQVEYFDWSYDSKELVYIKRIGFTGSEIVSYNLAGNTQRQFPSPHGYVHSLACNPVNDRIVFVDGYDLIVCNSDGSEQKKNSSPGYS